MITKTRIFEVYEDRNQRRLFTLTLDPGKKVYDEQLINQDGCEFREWDPYSSKLAAAILLGCPNIFIRKDDIVLYLGSSSGTTASHVSDIVGKKGFVFAVDSAPRVMRDLVFNLEGRENVAAILEDANQVQKLAQRVSSVDVVYQDIAQKNQLEIFLKNIKMFLKKDGYALLTLKAKSIDIARRPKDIFKEVRENLEIEYPIIDARPLEPFQKDHMFYIIKKK